MRVVALPGAFHPISDTWMLGAELARAVAARSRPRVLDLGTGSGALGTIAALAGGEVTSADLSRRALWSARATAAANGVALRTVRGDLFAPVAGERFDVIVSNPPYVPADSDELPARGPGRATDAGRDGRAVLDRICAAAARYLRRGGELLLVHSEVCGEDATLEALRQSGLRAETTARHRGGLGRLLTERRDALVARGLLEPGQREEDVVVIRAVAA